MAYRIILDARREGKLDYVAVLAADFDFASEARRAAALLASKFGMEGPFPDITHPHRVRVYAGIDRDDQLNLERSIHITRLCVQPFAEHGLECPNAAPESFAPLGVVSEGTLKVNDVIPALFDVLQEHWWTKAAQLRDEYCATYEAVLDHGEELTDEELDDAQEMLRELEEAMGTLCRPYTHYGASEGDGALFGCFIDSHGLEEALHDEDIVAVGPTDHWPAYHGDASPTFALAINDHGNQTLMMHSLHGTEDWSVEVWAIV